MLAKLRYYLMRMREAPIRITANKIWLHAKPYVHRFSYSKTGPSGTELGAAAAARRANAAAFGGSIAANLREAALRDPGMAARATARAQRALHGRIGCLGYGETAIPSGPQWHVDAFHGHAWPNAYFADVDFVAAHLHCDVKVPWELSRLQFLVWLAEGAVFDAGRAALYRERFGAIVDDWLSSNPTGYGVNWTCLMEAAIRVVNLVLSYAVFAADLDDALSARILVSLDQHIRFIETFLEISDVPGNHYLADLAGRVFALAVAPGENGGDLKRGIADFAAEAERQFEPEGCHLERAPVYHRLCTDMVALVLGVAQRHGHPDTARLTAIVARAVAFCRAVSSASGKLPIIGDCDSGMVLDFGNDARAFLGLEQSLLGLQAGPVSVTDDFAHWILAVANVAPAAAAMPRPTEPAGAASAGLSGFISARCGDLAAVMRVGTQGLKGRASHDHDDALSIWLTKGGRDLIVEEGCHSYTLDPVIRSRYIGSAAHNVVQPAAGQRYSGMQGSICLTARGAPTASAWSHKAEQAIAELDASLETPPRPGQPFAHCRRTVRLETPDQMVVNDDWAWREAQASELRWHFAPGLTVEIAGHEAVVRDADGQPVLKVNVEAGAALGLAAFPYAYSPVYGLTIPAQGLSVSVPPAEKCAVRSTFTMLEENRSAG